MKPPSTNGSNGLAKDAKGRFAKGNAGGPGNPLAARVASLRAALVDAVKPADIQAVAAALLAQAKAGDVPSIKELLQRLLGPPVELDVLERVDQLEQRLAAMDTGGGRAG